MKINKEIYHSLQSVPVNIRKACLEASWKSWSRPFVVRADGNFRVVTLNIFNRLAAAFLRIFHIDYFKRILGAKEVTPVKREELVQADQKVVAIFEKNVVPPVQPVEPKAGHVPPLPEPRPVSVQVSLPAPVNLPMPQPVQVQIPVKQKVTAPSPHIPQPRASAAGAAFKAPSEVEEHNDDPIVKTEMTIKDFIQESYTGSTGAKYVERLRHLSNYFGKNRLFPTRGDGNCFANATVAGLLCLAARDPAKLTTIIKALQDGVRKTQSYVTPDTTNTAPPYSKSFTKEKDFALVLNSLQKPQGNILKLLERQDFTASFSRVIRYLCLCQQVAQGGFIEVSPRSGEDMDMHAIMYANACFGIQAKMAVLEAPVKDVNPDQSDRAYIKGGTELTFDQSMVDLKQGTPQEKQADFVIIRKAGHYMAMV
ncbi:MAG: hypothetical protein LLG04_09985 [Parachlamydia sp.]|nr:hypothetical protein [Parachlamydia sp.]